MDGSDGRLLPSRNGLPRKLIPPELDLPFIKALANLAKT